MSKIAQAVKQTISDDSKLDDHGKFLIAQALQLTPDLIKDIFNVLSKHLDALTFENHEKIFISSVVSAEVFYNMLQCALMSSGDIDYKKTILQLFETNVLCAIDNAKNLLEGSMPNDDRAQSS